MFEDKAPGRREPLVFIEGGDQGFQGVRQNFTLLKPLVFRQAVSELEEAPQAHLACYPGQDLPGDERRAEPAQDSLIGLREGLD